MIEAEDDQEGQPAALAPGREEDEQLAQEASHRRDARQRQQTERHARRDPRAAPTKAVEVADVLFARRVRQRDDARERADIGDDVDEEEDQHRRRPHRCHGWRAPPAPACR